jgi:hypothetical protein
MRASIRSRSAPGERFRPPLLVVAIRPRWRRRPPAGCRQKTSAQRVSSTVDLARRQRRPDDGLRAVLRQVAGEIRPTACARRLQRGQRAGVGEQSARAFAGAGSGNGLGPRRRNPAGMSGLLGPALADLLRTAVDQPQGEASGAALAQQVGDDGLEVFLVGLQVCGAIPDDDQFAAPQRLPKARQAAQRSGVGQFAQQARQCRARRGAFRAPSA